MKISVTCMKTTYKHNIVSVMSVMI